MSEPEEARNRDLPTDPSAEYYLTNCYVCQEEAKPGQVRKVAKMARNIVHFKFLMKRNDYYCQM
jgi:hypothetical protein